MNLRYRLLTGGFAALLLLNLAAGQRRRDPLTDQETDQLREAAQNPEQRFKLYTRFIDARFLAIQQLQVDPKMEAERGMRIHDLLDDLNGLIGEVEDNVDDYDKQGQDLRKPLKPLVEAVTGWQLKLRTLKDASLKDPEAQKESKDYYFTLDTAIDTVNGLADDARDTLAEEQQRAAAKKKH